MPTMIVQAVAGALLWTLVLLTVATVAAIVIESIMTAI